MWWIIALAVWGFGSLVIFLMIASTDAYFDETDAILILFWPLLLLKWTLKTLFFIFFDWTR